MGTRRTPASGELIVIVAADRFSVSPRDPIRLVGASICRASPRAETS
jgi:hypothetical protein